MFSIQVGRLIAAAAVAGITGGLHVSSPAAAPLSPHLIVPAHVSAAADTTLPVVKTSGARLGAVRSGGRVGPVRGQMRGRAVRKCVICAGRGKRLGKPFASRRWFGSKKRFGGKRWFAKRRWFGGLAGREFGHGFGKRAGFTGRTAPFQDDIVSLRGDGINLTIVVVNASGGQAATGARYAGTDDRSGRSEIDLDFVHRVARQGIASRVSGSRVEQPALTAMGGRIRYYGKY